MIYRLIYIVVLLISFIPFPVGQFIGKILGSFLALVPVKRMSISLENIERSLDDSIAGDKAKKLNRQVFIHFGQVLFEVPHILRLNNRNLNKYVKFVGEDTLLKAIEKKKGVFVLTGHFGNWELMSVAIDIRFEPQQAIVARNLDYPPLDRLITHLRSRFGTEVIPKQRAMRRVMKAIREKKIVGILLDQNVDWYEGVFVKFLGRWACTNKGLALMALKTGAPVVPAFPVRKEDGRYHVIFENEIELVRTGDQAKDIEQNTALFTDIIETYIRRYPDRYFWFHRRWKTKPYCPLPDDFYLSHKTLETIRTEPLP